MGKTETKATKSKAIELLDLVWECANSATGHSYERLNHAMRTALSLAIGAGFEFAVDDIAYIFSHYRSGYWLGESVEWIYSEAVAVDNDSAIKSFEKHKSRQPLIADDVSGETRSYFTHGSFVVRKKCRLFVGAKFHWRGVYVEVTSFAEDSSHVVACSYKRTEDQSRKIEKRFTISREDIIKERADRKLASVSGS